MSADHPKRADFVQSLERGLTVIRAFDAEHRERGLSEVARATGLTRAAARRFLLTLVALGYMSQTDGRFALTPRVLELGYPGPPRRIMSITLSVGTRLPAFATSMGRVLLAALSPAELEAKLAEITIAPLSARPVSDEAGLRAAVDRARMQG